MSNDLKKAIALLEKDGLTCVFVNGEKVFSSTKRGVKPLLEFLESGTDFSAFSVADKVVGKGAGFLYILLKVKAVYAKVISKHALNLLNENGVKVYYDELVLNVQNRSKTGLCPIETAVLSTYSPTLALEQIKRTLESLTK
ncbi:MAG: DUF1893 domain-containing protein [Clostridia bacterium]|nr:DUF1893 domain-containing protein [Clostridia bacterium]